MKLHVLAAILILVLLTSLLGSGLLPARAQPPALSIYDVQYTDDPGGDSPYLGQVVTVGGIVTALDPGRVDGLDGYFIEAPEGGPWSGIYIADPSGNRPAPGDHVQVTGLVAEMEGLTAITDLEEFTVLSNNNPLPPAQGVTTDGLASAGEPWEGVLIAVHGATVVDANPDEPEDRGEWLVVDASGTPVRVDDLTRGYTYEPVEGDELAMVRGAVYFADGAFKIEPRDDRDILQMTAFTSIRAIQFVPEGADDDASPLLGQQVTTVGVVTGVFPPVGYFIEDPRGGPWSGLWVSEEKDLPLRGTYIELKGTVAEFFGRTQIENVVEDSVIVHSIENPLPVPAQVSTADIGTRRPNAESYEGVLVRVGPVTVVNANPDAPDDFGEWLIADTSGVSVRVGALGNYTYERVPGDELAYVQGPLDFDFGDRKIQPRDDDDIGTQAVTIAQARASAPGTSVSVEGIVTVPAGTFDPGFAMQDGTAGIYVFHPDGFPQDLTLNRVVQVTGVITEVNGLLEIVPGDPVSDVAVTGQSPPVPPLEIGTGNIGEGTEGWLVSIEGTVIERDGDTFTVDDGSGPAQVFVAPTTGIDISVVAVGQAITVVGFSGQFDPEAPFDQGYRVQPRFQEDVNPSGVTNLTPTLTFTPTPPTVFRLDLGTLFRNYGGCTSRYTVTNEGDGEATVLHELTGAEGGTHTLTDVIAAGETKTYDLATAPFSPPLPESFTGPGTLSADQPVTVAVQRCPQGTVATLFVMPGTLTVGLNGVADMGLQVTNAPNLYGIEMHLAFDPTMLQVEDADPERAGVQIRVGAALQGRQHFVATNRADNEAGTVDFVASLLSPEPPITGGAELAVIPWKGINPGQSEVRYTGAVLADPDGQPIAVVTQDGAVNVLQATATATPSATAPTTVTPTPTSTPRPPTPTPTSTPTPTLVPTPTCDAGLCSGIVLVRAYHDRWCDRRLSHGVDPSIQGAEVTLRYDNGASATVTTDLNGFAVFGGVNVPEGATVTLSIRWPALAQGEFIHCPNSRETATLTSGDFSFGSAYLEFRARVRR